MKVYCVFSLELPHRGVYFTEKQQSQESSLSSNKILFRMEQYFHSSHRSVNIGNMELQTGVLSTLAACHLGDVT